MHVSPILFRRIVNPSTLSPCIDAPITIISEPPETAILASPLSVTFQRKRSLSRLDSNSSTLLTSSEWETGVKFSLIAAAMLISNFVIKGFAETNDSDVWILGMAKFDGVKKQGGSKKQGTEKGKKWKKGTPPETHFFTPQKRSKKNIIF